MNWPDALNTLPEREPRADAWARIEADPRLADLRADTALDHLLGQLPTHEPHADAWAHIGVALTAEETLDRALTALPTREPRADLWEQLTSRLDETQPDTGQIVAVEWGAAPAQRRVGSRWLAAASVLLVGLVSGWLYLRNVPQETVTVAYSVEMTTDVPGPVTPDAEQAEQHLETYINQLCEQQVMACKKPEVQTLRHQLTDLDERKAQINKQLTVFGNDPQLVKAQVRIENERADVTKELVRILTI
jgi:hypothetical protein